jgi:hypothetical protein
MPALGLARTAATFPGIRALTVEGCCLDAADLSVSRLLGGQPGCCLLHSVDASVEA